MVADSFTEKFQDGERTHRGGGVGTMAGCGPLTPNRVSAIDPRVRVPDHVLAKLPEAVRKAHLAETGAAEPGDIPVEHVRLFMVARLHFMRGGFEALPLETLALVNLIAVNPEMTVAEFSAAIVPMIERGREITESKGE